ncbi:acyl-CoA N-acyltransferase [Bipolaris maydis]|nr:hypothetical protein BM1_09524 [Bipolaris maydis]KAJ5029872.1 acyl-CoA N-acyltransferase [Bipolaris maydis]KAJ6200088.1 acyl-CoA N-acyltransferase [Bipolaris maydis]KAJ6285423.1 acyl-CoA N-acyltransferase [Bipolaris maydis]
MPFKYPNPWRSPRLHYRAIRPCDKSVFLALAADPAMYMASTHATTKLPTEQDAEENMHQGPPGSGEPREESLLQAIIWRPHDTPTASLPLEQKEAVLEEMKRQNPAEILDAEYGVAVGHIHSAPSSLHEAHHRTMEIALDILPAYQGKGYGSEAINWALDFGFRRAGLHSVRLRAFGWNKGAIRLYERLGFVVEGREREAVWFEGAWWDSFTLGMLDREWRAREAGKEEEEEEEEEEEAQFRHVE